jgi:hypothetical protein
MMKEELEQRLGYTLEPWQWEMAHWIYQNHPEIPDVVGKDVLAKKIKEGGEFEYNSVIYREYLDMDGPDIIKEHKQDLYTTYDVNHKGYCVNTQGRLIEDIFKDVEKALKEKYPYLLKECDYFNLSCKWEIKNKEMPATWTQNRWLVIHYVKGGSEGYYVHVATVDGLGQYRLIFLAKTLNECESGISWAEKMVAALSRIMEV